MKHTIIALCSIISLGLANFSGATTVCDDQAKPAFSCPTGYSVMCIATSNPHWGCGKESGGVIIEIEPVMSAATLDSAQSLTTSPASVTGDLTVETGALGKTFVLDGTKSQDDGIIRTFLWRQVSGPTVPLSDAHAIAPSFTPPTFATYVFELVVTDSTGLSSVAQRSTFVIGSDASVTATASPVPPALQGDPDFDVLKTAPPPGSIGDLDRDGTTDKTAPTNPNESHEVDGQIMEAPPAPSPATADQDQRGDRVDFVVHEDAIKELRSFTPRTNTTGMVKEVTVRGWDPAKKEEILAKPEQVQTPEALKIYAEAVMFDNPAISDIRAKDSLLEVKSRFRGKLLGFIPVSFTGLLMADLNYDASPEPVKLKLPWWSVFVKKGQTFQEQHKALVALHESEQLKNFPLQNAMSRMSQMMQMISNITKANHDAAMNAIRNMK